MKKSVKKTEKNSYIFTENEKLGRLLLVEGEDNTTEVHKIKADGESVFTLAAPWWDLDNIKREVKKNEKKIREAMNFHVINGIYGKIDGIVADFIELDGKQRTEVRKYIEEKLNI